MGMTRSEIARLIELNPHSLNHFNITQALLLSEDSAGASLVKSTIKLAEENPYSAKHLCKSRQTLIEEEDPEFADLLQKKAAFEEKSPEEQTAEIASGKKNFNFTEALEWAKNNPEEYAAAVKDGKERGLDLATSVSVGMVEHAKKNGGAV